MPPIGACWIGSWQFTRSVKAVVSTLFPQVRPRIVGLGNNHLKKTNVQDLGIDRHGQQSDTQSSGTVRDRWGFLTRPLEHGLARTTERGIAASLALHHCVAE
jgi:hypothetical protein